MSIFGSAQETQCNVAPPAERFPMELTLLRYQLLKQKDLVERLAHKYRDDARLGLESRRTRWEQLEQCFEQYCRVILRLVTRHLRYS